MALDVFNSIVKSKILISKIKSGERDWYFDEVSAQKQVFCIAE